LTQKSNIVLTGVANFDNVYGVYSAIDMSGWAGSGTPTAGYFSDGTNTVSLADGTYAINTNNGPVAFNSGSGGSYDFGWNGINFGVSFVQQTADGQLDIHSGTWDSYPLSLQFNNNGAPARVMINGATDDGISALQVADTGGTYAISATGDVYINGKTTSTGSYDPPFVLYDVQTKEQIVARARNEIPTEKAGGMAQVYIPSDPRIKWFQPSSCTFFAEKADKDGYMVKVAVDIISDGKPCYNTNTTTLYSWDAVAGKVASHQAAQYPRIPMPEDKTLDSRTGELQDMKPKGGK